MTAPGEILLVSCYELGHQPLAVASAAAFLERAGFHPDALDLSVEALDPAKVARAKLVAISVPMHTALRLGVAAAGKVRAINPAARICFFGLYAALNAEWLLAERHADAVAGGEADEALVALARGEGAASSVTVARLDYPPPSRARLPQVERYAHAIVNGEERVAAAVETTRGCLHRCRHCPIPAVYDGRFFAVPVETVLADVRALVAAGVRHLTFADPDFWNGPAHARRVVQAVHAEFPHLTFDATIKIEHLLAHREMLPALAASGCVFVVSAVESLSDRVLSILDKGHSRAGVAEALALTRAVGIALRPSLLPFTPWSTREDYVDLLDWIAEEDLSGQVDPVQLSIRLLVPPGSLLESHPEFLPHRGALDRDALTWRWRHPDPEMDVLAARATAIAAEAARTDESPERTFARFADAARVVGARDARAVQRRPSPPAPRLTEPWFC